MMNITLRDGTKEPIREHKINTVIQEACRGLPGANWSDIATSAAISFYDGITTEEVDQAAIMAAHTLTQKHPDYSKAAGRLLLRVLYQAVFGAQEARTKTPSESYREQFARYLETAVHEQLLAPDLLEFDLPRLADALVAERDDLFRYQGMKILSDRYLLKNRAQQWLELPQWMWMRVAMGLALAEAPENRTTQAIAFYEVLSTHRYVPGTPTLFNSGAPRPQLSSCYVTTVPDDLAGIFANYSETAQLSKWAGGIGTDWTRVRASGSQIKGTNGKSHGIVPWLRIVSDIAVAVNQGGRRKGAHCAYLETWHRDLTAFLDLRKNVGDERARTPDMNTAHWIPDLFMERVRSDGNWTLMSPADAPDLHDQYGTAFAKAYEAYEAKVARGEMDGQVIKAKDLWKKMLAALFETGHPWITFKDPSNLRNPQRHAGVIHNSNLCTEILLNNSDEETAVCTIGSVNLNAHIRSESENEPFLDMDLLADTVRVAVRMLDNVLDVNFYPTDKAAVASRRHRPVGLGVMGWQDALYRLGIRFESETHIQWADKVQEQIAYQAISASSDLAVERGRYASYEGSLWSQGVFPLDSMAFVEAARGRPLPINRQALLPWNTLKDKVARQGLRNSHLMAIAPTATISSIVGVSASIEPTFSNLYVTSNLSGDFTVFNEYLVRDLERLGLWSADLAEVIRAVDGDLRRVKGLPAELAERYPDVFAIDQAWLIKAAAARQKWIDQGQSLNLYQDTTSAKALHEMYFMAWEHGLKTTYYLRTLGHSQVEKGSVDIAKHGRTHLRTRAEPAVAKSEEQPKACLLNDPGCESCQ